MIFNILLYIWLGSAALSGMLFGLGVWQAKHPTGREDTLLLLMFLPFINTFYALVFVIYVIVYLGGKAK